MHAAANVHQAGPAVPPAAARVRPRRIRTHLILLTVLSLAPAIAVTAAAMLLAVQQQNARTQALLERKTAGIAAVINAELQRTVGALTVLGSTTAMQRDDLRSFHEIAQRVAAADGNWDNILLIGKDGEQLANARVPFGTALPRLTRPELPLKALVAGEPVISDVAPGAVARKMLTAVYVPVLRNGVPTYVLAAGIEPQTWEAALARELPPGATALLLDRFSFVIATARSPTASDEALQVQQSPGELARHYSAPALLDKYFRSSYQVATSGWRVVTLMPRATAAADLWTPLTYLALAMLTLAACSILLSVMLARRLARALRSLEGAATGARVETPFTEVNESAEHIRAMR